MNLTERVWRLFGDDPLSVAEIADGIGETRDRTKNCIQSLRLLGLINRVSKGVYERVPGAEYKAADAPTGCDFGPLLDAWPDPPLPHGILRVKHTLTDDPDRPLQTRDEYNAKRREKRRAEASNRPVERF